ncbi:aspartyl protease family protein [Parabacteroides sp. FAFU027]|uniref:aspartyl protease family protein n=1 Tax=Parabacteroides sp. FAFU027 TaxID=2922715 RepID=UPI001FAEC806|nr:aspartyl protease family protein [Parabacteroides sp. FAFU027]
MKFAVILLSFWMLIPQIEISGKSKKIASIPFEVVGSYIVIKARINKSSPLNLILDSGIRSTLITELTAKDSVSLNYSQNVFLKGLGVGNQLQAFTSTGNDIDIGKIRLQNQSLYVLAEDVFNLSRHTGTKINGLIGSDFFQGHVVEINYDRRRIVFYEDEGFIAPKKYSPLELDVEGLKMFVHIQVVDPSGHTKTVKMLVDTGAELAAWFRAYGVSPVALPKSSIHGFIGQGLNGEITGFIGRIPRIKIGSAVIFNPVVSFPDSTSIADVFTESQRDGTIGSQILSRFNLIFNEPDNTLYVRPNARFSDGWSYNIAGIELVQMDPLLRLSEVLYVWANSPAEKAGVQKGDRILEVNGKRGFDTDINEIKGMFEVSSKRPMRMILLRGDKTVSVEIDMKSKL